MFSPTRSLQVFPWWIVRRPTPAISRALITRRSYSIDYEAKYAEKLHQRAREEGLSVSELRAKAREDERRRKKEIDSKRLKEAEASPVSTEKTSPSGTSFTPTIQKDGSSPNIRPLSSFLNVPRLLATPHTPEQVSALWTAYHATRGTGYLCACVPIDAYETMARVAEKYPTFIVPIPREGGAGGDGKDGAYEFYFLQWGFHGSPHTDAGTANPPTSTVLFTPLEEYKRREAFATPHLVLTHYTDLAHTHGVVLLRGEITPVAAGKDEGRNAARGEYLLGQEEAHVMAVGVQKFYLWGQGGVGVNEREKLLKAFHEAPEEFKWEDVLKHANVTV